MSILNNISTAIRKNMLRMAFYAGKQGAHIGPALSLTEIMAVLYFSVMNFDSKNPTAENRDRLVLSKGHGVIAQYAALKELGLIDEDELSTFKQDETRLYAHPSINPALGIEFSSGSLGQGLSQGVGCALALRHKGNSTSKVYVILGDGECNEGSVWEAAMFASHQKLNNLVVIVDKNDIQYDEYVDKVLSMTPLDKKWESFGFEVVNVNGHDIDELKSALNKKTDKPLAVIAQTVKGKGVSFMENVPKWHNSVLTEDLYNQAIEEMGGVL